MKAVLDKEFIRKSKQRRFDNKKRYGNGEKTNSNGWFTF